MKKQKTDAFNFPMVRSEKRERRKFRNPSWALVSVIKCNEKNFLKDVAEKKQRGTRITHQGFSELA